VNELHDAVEAGHEKEKVVEVLMFLVKYVGEHFASEEQLMEETNYPGTGSHKREHARLVGIVEQRTQEYIVEDAIDEKELVGFVADWIGDHVLQIDRQFADYLHEHATS